VPVRASIARTAETNATLRLMRVPFLSGLECYYVS
jgi:hypothetical protein